MNTPKKCARCGIVDDTVIDLDTGSACHPWLADCVAAMQRQRDELLEAMQGILRITDRKHDAWDRAKAAIANASK